MKQIIFYLSLFAASFTQATTWDEPWADSVILNSDSFGLYNVVKVDEDKATLELIKYIAGVETPKKIQVDGYSHLKLSSGHYGQGTEIGIYNGKETYFFLNKTQSKKKWKVATPTSGFDIVHEGKVFSNFRHSYQRMEVSPEKYELVMTAVFKNYHGVEFDRVKIDTFISKQLSMPPSIFNEDITLEGMQQHFLQQLALEAIHHLGGKWKYSDIEPFIKSKGYYTEISASRSLVSLDVENKIQMLCDLVTTDINGFSKVIMLWYLEPYRDLACSEKLEQFVNIASEDDVGFGGSIMDTRVGTYFPESEKIAIQTLLDRWRQSLPER